MSWVKVDDRMAEHPKMLAAGPLAGYLYLCAIQYANRNRTDGFIPARAIHTLIDLDGLRLADESVRPDSARNPAGFRAPSGDITTLFRPITAVELADALVDNGLWERVAGGYRVHDYLDYQNSAAEISRYHANERERKRVSRLNGSGGFPRAVRAESGRIPPRKKKKEEVEVDVLKEVNDPNTSDAAGSRARARTAAAAADVPTELSQFDATLRGLPGYTPTAAFYAKVTDYQPALDLAEEAIKMAGWLQQPSQQRAHRQCSPGFVLGWLKREREYEHARAAAVGARGDNGRGPGPRVFGRQQTSGAEMRRQALALGWVEPDPELDAGPAE